MSQADNVIHPTAAIDAGVKIGSGNTIGAFTVITGNVTIGDGNWIGPHVTIGTPAQYSSKKFELHGEEHSGISIGNRNVIREYCTVHQASKYLTAIEDDCYLMAYCHVSHDTRIRNGAILANNTQIGGFSDVGERCNVGLSSVLHQFTTIGAYAMIGMGSILSKDILPFSKVVGSPARFIGVNTVGMQRNGFTDEQVDAVTRYLNGQDATLDNVTRAYFDHVRSRAAENERKVLATA